MPAYYARPGRPRAGAGQRAQPAAGRRAGRPAHRPRALAAADAARAPRPDHRPGHPARLRHYPRRHRPPGHPLRSTRPSTGSGPSPPPGPPRCTSSWTRRGALLLAEEDGITAQPSSAYRRDRAAAVALSPRLAHDTGANGVFTSAGCRRPLQRRPGRRWSAGGASGAAPPPGAAVPVPTGTAAGPSSSPASPAVTVDFFLEYDTGTEPLTRGRRQARRVRRPRRAAPASPPPSCSGCPARAVEAALQRRLARPAPARHPRCRLRRAGPRRPGRDRDRQRQPRRPGRSRLAARRPPRPAPAARPARPRPPPPRRQQPRRRRA